MRRTILLLTVAAMLATMLLALAGPSLAKDPQPKQESYTDSVKALQYAAARLPTPEDPEQRGSWFRGSAEDRVDDQDPGLDGQLDTMITYTGGSPSEGGTNTLTGGEWMLCSDGFVKGPLDLTVSPPKPIPPECKPPPDPDPDPDSRIALKGTWTKGEAQWDTGADTVVGDGFNTICLPAGLRVYTGTATLQGKLTVSGGTVKGKTVTGGSGKFEGTLDHRPLALTGQCDLDPRPEVFVPNPARAPIIEGTMKLQF